MCITRLCRATHVWFKGRYWPAVHWLVFNQSERCNGCELPVLSKHCEILLYTLELREWVRALVCVVFSDGVLLSAQLLLTALISLGESDSWPQRFCVLSGIWFCLQGFFPSHLLSNQTVSCCGSLIGQCDFLGFGPWVWLTALFFGDGGRGRTVIWLSICLILKECCWASCTVSHALLLLWELLQFKLSQTVLYIFVCCEINPLAL